MKKNKYMKIGAVAVVVVLLGVVLTSTLGANQLPPLSTTTLVPGELLNTVSIKGTVESVNKKNIYSTLGFSVKTLNVEVGDEVKEGQTLAVLDTEALELNIAQSKADLDALQKSNLNQLANNERLLNEASSNLKGGKNTQVLNAESAFKTAEVNLQNAQKNYDDLKKEYNDGSDTKLSTAESNLLNAKLDLDTKKTAFENNKSLLSSGVISSFEYEQSENAYNMALNKYNESVTAQNKSLEQSETALKTAKINYDNAKAVKEAASINANQDLQKYKSSVTGSQISVSNDSSIIAIQKLEKQLKDSTIISPISGTVTAVFAKENAGANGLLFVVEDTKNLKITTKVKEYDASKVKTGMEVTIKSDSTGENVYNGVVDRIDPTAIKNASGETSSSTDVEFGAVVNVMSEKTDLKVGMNARLNIVLEKKEDVFSVPFDAIVVEENGDSFIFLAENNVAKKVMVEVGMETDFLVEVKSEKLSADMKVINDATDLKDGDKITLK